MESLVQEGIGGGKGKKNIQKGLLQEAQTFSSICGVPTLTRREGSSLKV